VGPLSKVELEAGLLGPYETDFDRIAFWDRNLTVFRQTVLAAIDETSEALLSPHVPAHWRAELESQLLALGSYLELADRVASGDRPTSH
jgi:hypothetical protein